MLPNRFFYENCFRRLGMNNFSTPAKVYILLTIITGLALSLWQLLRLETLDFGLLALAALAAAAQLLKLEGPTERSSYNISWLVYGFTLALLGAPAAVLVILAAHLVEWLRYRYPWYIQLFNIGSYAVAITAAGLVFQAINPGDSLMTAAGAVAALLAVVVFTLLNHLLVGLVLMLARGESLTESGVFDILPLMMDLTMFGVGVASALLWLVNPAAILFNLIPLYLFYNALKVPRLQRQVAQLEERLEELDLQAQRLTAEPQPGLD
jgi:hypothetical protein